MILNIVVCMACVQVAAVGVASGKSLSIQPHNPEPFTAHHRHLATRAGLHDARHLDTPHHIGGGHPYRLDTRDGTQGGGRGPEYECGQCPAAHDITPCVCMCVNNTAAEIVCGGPELTSCSQLTELMSLTTYPVSAYLRLVVADTSLACTLEKNLWGSLVFQEIVITNNHFQVIDNLAFQPFSATLTTLDLEGNTLKNVYFPTMNDTPLLRTLKLSHNALYTLPGYSAIALPLLEVFNVSHNRIESISREAFAGMPKLQTIELSHNRITKLHANAFRIPDHDATSLTINLANNQIFFIEPGLLDGVRVCSIDLRDNRLTILPEDVYRPIIDFTAAAAFFWTDNNPFDCDSQFCWIAINKTVSDTFNTVLCPNLDNHPVEILTPMCMIDGSNSTTIRRSRTRPRTLPQLLPGLAPVRNGEALPVV